MTEKKGYPAFAVNGKTMDLWFEEKLEMQTKSMLRIKIERTLHSEKSEFQNLAVVETKGMGRMLVLDGIIMLTEMDECSYHEMIAHVPLMTHPDPQSVLVIGGGDGGTIREVIKHPGVKRAHLCEIDRRVVEVSREYLPSLAEGLDDPRVECFYEDGAAFIANRPNEYDVIIVDSSDPIGPAEVLFKEPFYRNLFGSLRENGIAVTQCESYFYHTEFVAEIVKLGSKIFPVCGYYYTSVPTYPSGMIGFAFCSKGPDPITDAHDERFASLKDLNYYNPQLHRACFNLPLFVRRKLPEGVINTRQTSAK